MSASSSRSRAFAIAGVCITAAILVFFMVRLDWREFVTAFRTLRPSWLLASCVTIAASVALRAVRWQRMSAPAGPFKAFWDATVVGYVGNVVYPARAGEALRIVALCRSTAMSPGHAIASAFGDRLADIFILGTVALGVLGLAKLGPQGDEMLSVVALLSALPVAIFIAFLRWGAVWGGWFASWAHKLPAPLDRGLPRWFAQAHEQTLMLRSPTLLAGVMSLTLLAALLDYVSIWLTMQAMGWSLPLLSAVLLGVLLALGTLIPAAPGYVGIYQIASVLALARYGVSEAVALAFSVVLQGVVLVAIVAHAIVVFAHYGWRMREFRLAPRSPLPPDAATSQDE